MLKCGATTLVLLAAFAAPAPADAFWQRSQWSRCSDAPTAAEWSRYRCWQLKPYHDGATGHGFGDADGFEGIPRGAVRERMAPGGAVVRRLG